MNFYTRKRRTPTVIIVSLIDIFAILLIFVIVTTTFKRSQPAVVIKLPDSTTAKDDRNADNPKLFEIVVSPEGVVSANKEELPSDSVPALAAALKPLVGGGQPLALRADTKAPYGMVLRVMEALKAAGVSGNLSAFTERKGN